MSVTAAMATESLFLQQNAQRQREREKGTPEKDLGSQQSVGEQD